MIYNDLNQVNLENIATQLSSRVTRGDIIFLTGAIGVGKSTFVRQLIRSYFNDPMLVVPSPTFTLVQPYDGVPSPIYHIDLYRLSQTQEIEELGIEEMHAAGILLIEWPDLIQQYGFAANLTIDISILPSNQRQITLAGNAKFLHD